VTIFFTIVPFRTANLSSKESTITRLHQFARSLLHNATAGGALWWLRKSHIVNYANHQHSPFAKRRHDFRQAAARLFKLHSPYLLVKVSWKSVQPFPRTVVSYFGQTEKKQKNAKKICKTYTHPHATGRQLRKKFLINKLPNATASAFNSSSGSRALGSGGVAWPREPTPSEYKWIARSRVHDSYALPFLFS